MVIYQAGVVILKASFHCRSLLAKWLYHGCSHNAVLGTILCKTTEFTLVHQYARSFALVPQPFRFIPFIPKSEVVDYFLI